MCIYIYMGTYCGVCLKIPCPTREVWLGGMIRGYDSGYDSWVWLADLDLVFPYILRVWLFTHTYPENVSTVGNYTIHGALWSWHAVDAVRAALRVVCVCVCALERASWCCWNAAARCWCRVLLAVRVVCTVWSDAMRMLVKGAAARCRVLLSDFSQKQQEA